MGQYIGREIPNDSVIRIDIGFLIKLVEDIEKSLNCVKINRKNRKLSRLMLVRIISIGVGVYKAHDSR